MTAAVHILGEGGGVFKFDLPLHEVVADKLAKGHIRRVNPDGTPYVEGDRPEGVPSLPESRPALNALKGEWVGWAVVQGLTPDEAEALTKQDLIDRFGTPAEANGQEGTPAEGTDSTPPADGTDPVNPIVPETPAE